MTRAYDYELRCNTCDLTLMPLESVVVVAEHVWDKHHGHNICIRSVRRGDAVIDLMKRRGEYIKLHVKVTRKKLMKIAKRVIGFGT